jgi:hypothetical protein
VNTGIQTLSSISLANDKRAYAWSAVTQLQSALGACEYDLFKKTPGGLRLTTARIYGTLATHDLASNLLAVCYKYLGEWELGSRALAHHREVYDKAFEMGPLSDEAVKRPEMWPLTFTQVVLNIANPKTWTAFYQQEKREGHYKEIAAALSSLS